MNQRIGSKIWILVGGFTALGVLGCGAASEGDRSTDEDSKLGEQGAAITGGGLVSSGLRPYTSTVNLGCTALKVAANWYLTASHCAFSVNENIPGFGVIDQSVVHPTAVINANHKGFDLRMLKLHDTNLTPAWTPSYAAQADPGTGRAVGFGCDTAPGSTNGGQKQYADFITAANTDGVTNTYAFMSTGDPALCPGDSGGPFFNIVNKVPYLTGVASTQNQFDGPNNTHPTGILPHVSGWARTNPAREWIEAVRADRPGVADFSEGNVGTFLSSSSNWCLYSRSAANGTTSQQPCFMADDSQERFTVHAVGSGFYEFHSVSTGNCLAIKGASTADGAAVKTQACDGSDNTKWSMEGLAIDTFDFMVQNKRSGKCMRPNSNALQDPIIQSSCDFNNSLFRWAFTN